MKSIKSLTLIGIIENDCQGPPIKHGSVSHRDVDMPQCSSSAHITIKLCPRRDEGNETTLTSEASNHCASQRWISRSIIAYSVKEPTSILFWWDNAFGCWTWFCDSARAVMWCGTEIGWVFAAHFYLCLYRIWFFCKKLCKCIGLRWWAIFCCL